MPLAAPVMAGVNGKEEAEILVLGMGTGTYAKQCIQYFGNVSVEGVEIDQKITDLAGEYFALPDTVEVTTYFILNEPVNHTHPQKFYRSFIIGQKEFPLFVFHQPFGNPLHHVRQVIIFQPLYICRKNIQNPCIGGCKQFPISRASYIYCVYFIKYIGNRVGKVFVDIPLFLRMHIHINYHNAIFLQMIPD